MVSTVSFKGTFKVNNQDPVSFSKFQKFAHQTYAESKESENGVKIGFKDKFVSKDGFENFDYKAEQTLIVPDSMDTDVETFCANNGISYKKYETLDLLNPEKITSRIAEAPKGYTKVNVDVEKLKRLAENQDSNIKHCRSDYDKYFSDKVDTMLRCGEVIPVTTLMIYDHNADNESLKRYVHRFGVNNLNKNQVFVDFNQRTDNPDHCVYFALKDMGMKKIPVYVDDKSYQAGTILGLF